MIQATLPCEDASLGPVWEQLLEGRWSFVRSSLRQGGVRFLIVENLPEDELHRLDARERKVIEMTAKGELLKVVAGALSLTESTTSRILAEALRKLGIDSRAHLALLSRVLGAR